MIKLFSPQYYIPICRFLTKRIPLVSVLLTIFLCYWVVLHVPADQEQGVVFKWVYIHVPAAFASMGLFVVIGVCSILRWVYHIKVAGWIASISARLGFVVTLIAISSGSIWGYYTWGAMWVWDPRLTTELLLLMLYMAFLVVDKACEQYKTSYKALMIIGVVGLLNIPLIHYSVVWWQSLHQGSTLLNLSRNTMPWEMLWPLLMSISVTVISVVSIVAFGVLQRANQKIIYESTSKS